MLRCRDGSYYTGVTNDVQRRFEQHANGLHSYSYTYERRPLTLVYAISFTHPLDAIHFEKALKDWNKKKKEALIRGDMAALRVHSKKKFPPRYKRKVAADVRMLQEAMGELIWACIECPSYARVATRATRDDAQCS